MSRLDTLQPAKVVSAPRSIVLCAGLKSSGSTWLYNAVIQVIQQSGAARRERGPHVSPFYADSLGDLLREAVNANVFIVKTHRPSASLEFLTRFADTNVLVSVREPRDAIASLIQRFHHRFDACLDEVSVNADRVISLCQRKDAIVFRYEDRFFDRPQTLDILAKELGVKLPEAARQRIFCSLTVANVEKKIRSLSRRGAFGRIPTFDSFDPTTHWHPGHVGDRQVGKFDTVLTAQMQRSVLQRMRDYCAVFGYPLRASAKGVTPPRHRAGRGHADRLAG